MQVVVFHVWEADDEPSIYEGHEISTTQRSWLHEAVVRGDLQDHQRSLSEPAKMYWKSLTPWQRWKKVREARRRR